MECLQLNAACHGCHALTAVWHLHAILLMLSCTECLGHMCVRRQDAMAASIIARQWILFLDAMLSGTKAVK